MAVSPTDANKVFVREVDDAVRDDQLRSFWDKYGKLLLVAILVGLIGYGGYLFYNHNKAQKAGAMSEIFVQALDETKAGNAAAAKTLASVKADGDDAYRAAAMLSEANLAAQKDGNKKASTLLGQLVADAKAPQVYRDLALIRQTTVDFDALKPEDVIARMKPLAVESNAFFPSAAELTALAYMKQGKDAQAGPLYGKIASHEATPEAMKSRAQQMAGMLGVDTVKTDTGKTPSAKDDAAAPAAAPSGEAPKADVKAPADVKTPSGEAK